MKLNDQIDTVKYADELKRMQMTMYNFGEIDCLKSLKQAFISFDEMQFNKKNIIKLIDSILKKADKA